MTTESPAKQTLPVSRIAPLPTREGGVGRLPPAEVAAVVADLARAAAWLVETADELVTAPAEARPALRATLYRWQTVLALGARRLASRQPSAVGRQRSAS